MSNKHTYTQSMVRQEHRVIDCLDCGYWHVDPMPTEAALEAFYTQYYAKLGDNRTMTDKLKDPDQFYTLQYEDRLRHAIKLIDPKLPKRALDIGAGYGDFLRFMHTQGWQTQGVEPSIQAINTIEDNEVLNVKQSSVYSLSRKDFQPASLITINNVLEHLRDPKEVLNNIIREKLLLPGGILLIIVPNDFNPLQDAMLKTSLKDSLEKQHYWVGPPTHLHYWTFSTLKAFVRSCGFTPTFATSDFPIELFPLMGENYILDPSLGRGAHLKRVALEKNLKASGHTELKDRLFKCFADLEIGRLIMMYCKLEG